MGGITSAAPRAGSTDLSKIPKLPLPRSAALFIKWNGATGGTNRRTGGAMRGTMRRMTKAAFGIAVTALMSQAAAAKDVTIGDIVGRWCVETTNYTFSRTEMVVTPLRQCAAQSRAKLPDRQGFSPRQPDHAVLETCQAGRQHQFRAWA
jgi:hypothetical protein